MALFDTDWSGDDRPRDFIAFVHRHPDELIVATDLLTTCRRKGRSWTEVLQYYHRTCGVPLGTLTTAICFLTEQHLLIRTRKRARHWSDQESILKAAPRALDELIHRLENNGEASPTPDPDAPRLAARQRLDATLHAVGFRGHGSSRLRVAK